MKIERISDNTISLEREVDIMYDFISPQGHYEAVFCDTIKIKTFYKKDKENEIWKWKMKTFNHKFLKKISNKYDIKLKKIGVFINGKPIEVDNYVLDEIVLGFNFSDINWVKKNNRNKKIKEILK
jgi:hypothetical protein